MQQVQAEHVHAVINDHFSKFIKKLRAARSSGFTTENANMVASSVEQLAAHMRHLRSVHALQRKVALSGTVMPGGVESGGDAMLAAVIDEHPQVFQLSKTFRKSVFVRTALARLLSHDPHAPGVSARLQCTAESRVYMNTSNRGSNTVAPVELLLRELAAGTGLSRGGRFFPPAACRHAFADATACAVWVRTLLQKKIASGFELPTPAVIAAAHQRGHEAGYDRWYDEGTIYNSK